MMKTMFGGVRADAAIATIAVKSVQINATSVFILMWGCARQAAAPADQVGLRRFGIGTCLRSEPPAGLEKRLAGSVEHALPLVVDSVGNVVHVQADLRYRPEELHVVSDEHVQAR